MNDEWWILGLQNVLSACLFACTMLLLSQTTQTVSFSAQESTFVLQLIWALGNLIWDPIAWVCVCVCLYIHGMQYKSKPYVLNHCSVPNRTFKSCSQIYPPLAFSRLQNRNGQKCIGYRKLNFASNDVPILELNYVSNSWANMTADLTVPIFMCSQAPLWMSQRNTISKRDSITA